MLILRVVIIYAINFELQDIAGIVYTIYESIGKSVVVPHCGSKTINVRLTVSPDSKTTDSTTVRTDQNNLPKNSKRQRLKPRKLVKCDDENDSGSGCFEPNIPSSAKIEQSTENNKPFQVSGGNNNVLHSTSVTQKSQNDRKSPNTGLIEQVVTESNNNRICKENESQCCLTSDHTKTPVSHDSISSIRQNDGSKNSAKNSEQNENIYESMTNLKCCTKANVMLPITAAMAKQTNKTKSDKFNINLNGNNSPCCRECRISQLDKTVIPITSTKPSVRKLIRKSRSRKQKNQDSCQPRVRSLSVGNERNFRGSHRNSGRGDGGGDASSGASGRDRNEECLNNLRRNDLIDIIRESMEKNRLCFQTNG